MALRRAAHRVLGKLGQWPLAPELRDFLTVVRLLRYRLGAEHPKAASASNAITELSRRL
jgi:hypothetical protein